MRVVETNVFAVLNLAYCHNVGEDWPAHEKPEPARIVYWESGMMWRAECPVCGQRGPDAGTPHVAAHKWNKQQQGTVNGKAAQ